MQATAVATFGHATERSWMRRECQSKDGRCAAHAPTSNRMRQSAAKVAERLFMLLAADSRDSGESCGLLAAVELTDDAGDVRACLAEGRDPAIAIDRSGAGVVSGERK